MSVISWNTVNSPVLPDMASNELSSKLSVITRTFENRDIQYTPDHVNLRDQATIKFTGTGRDIGYLIYVFACIGDEGVNIFSDFPLPDIGITNIRQMGDMVVTVGNMVHYLSIPVEVRHAN